MKNKNLYAVALVLIAGILSLPACKEAQHPDVEAVEITLNTRRLDRDLAAIDTNAIAAELPGLKKKYPYFLDFYLDTLMGFQIHGDYSETNPYIAQGLHTFLTYPDFRGLFDSIAYHYPDTKDIDAQLKKGFQYLKYYYPHYPIPDIIYLNSI